jgi:hypothetical protein
MAIQDLAGVSQTPDFSGKSISCTDRMWRVLPFAGFSQGSIDGAPK